MKIAVVVKTGAKVEGVLKREGVYEVRVKARPIEGKANQAVVNLLSSFFGLSRSKIYIKSGLKSKNKIVDIGN